MERCGSTSFRILAFGTGGSRGPERSQAPSLLGLSVRSTTSSPRVFARLKRPPDCEALCRLVLTSVLAFLTMLRCTSPEQPLPTLEELRPALEQELVMRISAAGPPDRPPHVSFAEPNVRTGGWNRISFGPSDSDVQAHHVVVIERIDHSTFRVGIFDSPCARSPAFPMTALEFRRAANGVLHLTQGYHPPM
jgi:hypothetical protein